MKSEEIKKYIAENLKIDIKKEPQPFTSGSKVTIQLLLEKEVIDKKTFYTNS